MKDKKVFIDELVNAFPEIKDEVLDEDYDGIISLQVGCFTRFTQKAIDINDMDKFSNCLKFVEKNMENVDFDIKNTLTISWLGKLNFNKNKNAYGHLTSVLRDSYTKLQQYYKEQPENLKLRSFLKKYR